MTIKAVDLFCGVGGLTYGLQKAGIPVVAGIDIDDSCEYAYTHNNNCTFIHKSVEDVTGKEIRALLRGADVKILVGCAPCQPFSSHQKDKQNRSKHKDWKLLYQFGRLVEETRPHIVSMENVPELEKEKVFKDFVSTLEGLNYIVNYQVVNVANYGVPQRAADGGSSNRMWIWSSSPLNPSNFPSNRSSIRYFVWFSMKSIISWLITFLRYLMTNTAWYVKQHTEWARLL